MSSLFLFFRFHSTSNGQSIGNNQFTLLQILNQRTPKTCHYSPSPEEKMWLKEADLCEKRLCLATNKKTLHSSAVFSVETVSNYKKLEGYFNLYDFAAEDGSLGSLPRLCMNTLYEFNIYNL